ncbi:MAG: thiamine phosphate synthase [Mariprofundaceae bacterium]|nr:thiamine phosphate synthase [Mariprofundaceae bacterium]
MKNITGIYGILPSDLEMEDMLARAESALGGGVRTLQMRDKKQDDSQALKRACALRELTSAYQAMLIINDSIHLALESGADGVHLGRDDIPDLARLRAEAGTSLLIGISCKGDMDLARRALDAGADYLSFGAIFPTASKEDAVSIGLASLHRARAQFADANIVAIGGISKKTLADVKAAGADAAAMIHALFSAGNIKLRATALVAAWEAA